MGQNQSATTSWSVDDWAYGTGQNTVSMGDVMEETGKLPAKYFGGQDIENDPSMHQMQRDLLSFDNTLKRIFSRKKNKRQKKGISQDEYYPQPIDSTVNQDYLPPTFVDGNQLPITDSANNEDVDNKLFWRCTSCTSENKKNARACRRCGQSETTL